jgi:hypothetical protein
LPLGRFLRLNLSKRGLGASVGVPGLRIGVDAGGKPYVSGGRGGLYFRRRLGTRRPGHPEAPTEGVEGPERPGIPWFEVIGWAVVVFGVVVLVYVIFQRGGAQ